MLTCYIADELLEGVYVGIGVCVGLCEVVRRKQTTGGFYESGRGSLVRGGRAVWVY
jgi:hypothetical protein